MKQNGQLDGWARGVREVKERVGEARGWGRVPVLGLVSEVEAVCGVGSAVA